MVWFVIVVGVNLQKAESIQDQSDQEKNVQRPLIQLREKRKHKTLSSGLGSGDDEGKELTFVPVITG